ncbi:phage tail tip lysozyme [Solirhodobacter olei]|uniref:phage tail tip lysozyme n=1 Tax=Solirhodobacter olei TaxID=2493082 RepID=UPI000FDA0588|nr:phage tail tip lysozyme [Solirhodobacter olei]
MTPPVIAVYLLLTACLHNNPRHFVEIDQTQVCAQVTGSSLGPTTPWITSYSMASVEDLAMAAGAKQSYEFWLSKGLAPAAALAMVADEQGESGFNWVKRGDGGAAGGSFQWHADRRADILRGTGIDVWNRNTSHLQQLRAAYWEMTQGTDAGARAAWSALTGAKTMAKCIRAAVRDFERTRHPVPDVRKRIGYAEHWLPLLIASAADHPLLPAAARQMGPTSKVREKVGQNNVLAGISLRADGSKRTEVGSLLVNGAMSFAEASVSELAFAAP